jgi:hypothetical protein
MGKALHIKVCTREGMRLFHIGVRLDRAIRILTIHAVHMNYDACQLYIQIQNIENAINSFKEFLDNSFNFFSNHSQDPIPILNNSPSYTKIINSLKTQLSSKKVTLSSPLLLPFFRSIKSADLCILISSQLGLSLKEQFFNYRNKFNEEMEKLNNQKNQIETIANRIKKENEQKNR